MTLYLRKSLLTDPGWNGYTATFAPSSDIGELIGPFETEEERDIWVSVRHDNDKPHEILSWAYVSSDDPTVDYPTVPVFVPYD